MHMKAWKQEYEYIMGLGKYRMRTLSSYLPHMHTHTYGTPELLLFSSDQDMHANTGPNL